MIALTTPRLTIVTVTYNAAHTVAHAVESVLGQDYPNLEYIVVDGQSTDGTMAVLEKYRPRLAALISEPDAGIYDAMNKGLRRATGEVVGLLNADDFYTAPDVLSLVMAALHTSGADALYADLEYVRAHQPDQVVRRWRAGAYDRRQFRLGWMPPHPTFFVRRKYYQQLGYFDTTLRSAADYELMLRFLYRHELRATYLPMTTVRMRTGGVSNRSLGHRLRANQEDRKAWQRNDLRPYFFTLWLKPLRKVGQFLPFGR